MKLLLVFAAAAVSAAPEADPAFAYSVGPAPLVYAAPTPFVYNYAPVQYVVAAFGCRNDQGAAVPCAGAEPYVAAPWAIAAPLPVAETAAEEPAVEVAARKKREAEAEPEADAEAEADPYLLYGLHGYHYASPYAYSAFASPYAYSGHYRHPAYAHPYAAYSYFGRKKREAEAAPEADADAYYASYGGYPYAYGYARGYSAYPYAGYGYGYGGCRNNYGGLVPCAGR